ncbi:GGDEF domain-containing protein [Bowmanella denitrificans]|uniref:GGDEF domain-containing protein n=1 Tax=Bowmanella denitrificans TaxID=366582 RepID=UPI0015589D4E|nr:GGDEF domain-containing protein [Bowmanella denitrificans]
MPKVPRTTEEWILLSISLLGALAILPFALLRLFNGDWLIAALDSFAVVAMLVVFVHVYVSGRVWLMSHVFAFLCQLVLVMTVMLRGAEQLFWFYPAALAVFFLLTPQLAVGLVGTALLALFLLLWQQVAVLHLAAFILSGLATMGFAGIFAWRTKAQQQKLLSLATLDPLTGAGNRRALEEKLLEAVYHFQRVPLPMSLILLDLDNFKQFNDNYGHEEGDRILVMVCKLIEKRIRRSDHLYRFGGEEFVVITDNTGLREAGLLAEELRKDIAQANISERQVTISLGIAQYHPGETGYQWLGRADQAMYRAKDSGRNHLCICAGQDDQLALTDR